MALFDKVVGALAQATKPLFKDAPSTRVTTTAANSTSVNAQDSAPATAVFAPDRATPLAQTLSVTQTPEGKVTPWLPGYTLGFSGSQAPRNALPESFIVVPNLAAIDTMPAFAAPYFTVLIDNLEPLGEVSYVNSGAGVSLRRTQTHLELCRHLNGAAQVVKAIAVTDAIVADPHLLFIVAADTISAWHAPKLEPDNATPLLSHGNENGIGNPHGVDMCATEFLSHARITAQGVSELTAGYTGYFGLRDPQWIIDDSGQPITRAGRRMLTMTCAGPGHFPTAHWGVFSVGTNSTAELLAPRLESLHFFERDRRVVGDHMGQIIVTEANEHLIAVSARSTFGRNPLHISRGKYTGGNGLYKGVHVHDVAPFSMPSLFDTWGPSFQKVGDSWYLAFVECLGYEPRFNFRPVLAVSHELSPVSSAYTRVGTDVEHKQTEGVILTNLGANGHVLLASDGDAREFPVYDLDMKRVAQVEAPYDAGIPHVLLVDAPGQPLRALSFNGTPAVDSVLEWGSHGHLVVFEAC